MASRPVTSPSSPTTCLKCGEKIWFRTVRNKTGDKPRMMPLDAQRTDAGNIAAVPGQPWKDARVLIPPDEPADGEQRFMPHFRTCTDPAAFRRRGRRRPPAVREPGEPAQPALFPAHDQEGTQ
jgi:hypothetical protein